MTQRRVHWQRCGILQTMEPVDDLIYLSKVESGNLHSCNSKHCESPNLRACALMEQLDISSMRIERRLFIIVISA